MSSVDVVVPCYKYAHYLRQCVESVLQQDGVAVRVLIIDDCSPDNTPEVGQQLAAEDQRVTYRRHEHNKGHIATYNEGLLEWASAEYCLLLSADDLLTPGALRRATQLLDAHPNVVMAYGRAPIVQRQESLPDVTSWLEDEQRIITGLAFIEYCCRNVANPVPTPTAVVRTSVQQAIGGYRPELPHSGDMEMWMRFALEGDIGVLSSPQAFYAVHGQNMSCAYYRSGLGDLPERKEAIDSLFANARQKSPQLMALHQLAIQSIAWESFWYGSAAWERGDSQTCRECMSIAKSMLPEITRERAWKIQLWKFRFGPQLVSTARILKSWVSQSGTLSSKPTTSANLATSDATIRWSGSWPA